MNFKQQQQLLSNSQVVRVSKPGEISLDDNLQVMQFFDPWLQGLLRREGSAAHRGQDSEA